MMLFGGRLAAPSSVRPAFSGLDPVRTTFILWPHQFPAGLLKNPVIVRAPQATSRTDVRSPARAEDVLRTLLVPAVANE